jgi:putative tryptophan/tyrosine transport system substrate-binding protein
VRRRAFIAGLLGGAAAWPITVRAQQPKRLPTIGFLGAGTASAGSQWAAAFVQRLRELNWIEDRTVAIEFRWTDGHNERTTEIAGEFVKLKVDVIVTYANTVADATKRTATTIPNVFAAAGDPVGTGLVASLARPGGNVTGLSLQQPEIASKRLQILRDLLPNLHTLAILANSGSPNAVLEMGGLMPQRTVLALLSFDPTYGKPKISRLRSTHSKAARKRSMFVVIRCSPLTVWALTPWRSECGCRQCMAFASLLKPEV